jgi:hypothetical protein
MKKHLRTVASLLLVAIMFSMTLPMISRSSAAEDGLNPELQAKQERQLADRLPPGVFKGEAMKQRIIKQRAKNKALDRAMRDKERAGKLPNWGLSAIFVFPEPKKKENAQISMPGLPSMIRASFAPPQDTLSDGTGEATFITYDGDPSTWDGTISVTDYYTGENRVYNSDMSDFGAPDDPAAWDVTNEIYYPPDGGDPTQCNPEGICQVQMTQYAHASKAPAPVGAVFRWFSRFWHCYTRTAAFVGRQCVSPQANIRNNLICAIAAGVYAAGCCARYANNNSGQGICYQ